MTSLTVSQQVSVKVYNTLRDMTIAFKRPAVILTNCHIAFDDVLELIAKAFIKDKSLDCDSKLDIARAWFVSLTEQEQLNVLKHFDKQLCGDYIQLDTRDEDIEKYIDYEDLYKEISDVELSRVKKRLVSALTNEFSRHDFKECNIDVDASLNAYHNKNKHHDDLKAEFDELQEKYNKLLTLAQCFVEPTALKEFH